MPLRKIISKMVTLNFRAQYISRITDTPSADEIRSSIFQALTTVLGTMGASSFVWDVQKQSITPDINQLSFSVTITYPTSKNEIQKFAAAASYTRAIGVDKVVLRVVN
jgi:hypothetical protein